MSSFIKRPGKPHNGDWAYDNNTDTDVCLECEIKTVNGDDIYWIARQKDNSFTIVNESYLSNIGYYGEWNKENLAAPDEKTAQKTITTYIGVA